MTGRLTLPVQTGMDHHLRELVERLGADAVRNSDGTVLPDVVHKLAAKVYATYFVARGDQAWADAHPDQATRVYLMSPRVTAWDDGDLRIRVMEDWFTTQVSPDVECDVTRWWQVIDRTTGETLPSKRWTVQGVGGDCIVSLEGAIQGHVYTVNFLATQIWDSTQMYNYLTNDWENEPDRVRERPYDVRYEETWRHMLHALDEWLAFHPEVDVVRFTTFFYHFTLVYGVDARERFVDWFGYSASVSVPAMEQFEDEYGYRLTPEDFVDEGYYNSTFRPPSRVYRDWINFQHRFVTQKVTDLVAQTHAVGKEAMMFLGDNWIGTEPYGPYFPATGIDAVVGSVGSGATSRMISDIPGVRYTEGRLLPYFFPDVFRPDGDPVKEANECWLPARRAIVRSPLDRIGYGGYLSLALEHPDFVARTEQIVAEFREIHERSAGERPEVAPFRVGILNAWGSLRSWQTHMVAHAFLYRQTYSYIGVLEALSGLPFEVDFLSFEDVRNGISPNIGVLVNVGAIGTAFSGGPAWEDPDLCAAIRSFVARGGGFIGVGDPTAQLQGGVVFQLSDVLGVDRETGWSLNTTRYPREAAGHFITAGSRIDVGEGTPGIFEVCPDVEVLQVDDASLQATAHSYGLGRSIYLAGLPYSHENSRLLHRALYWAAGHEHEFGPWTADDPRVEVAYYAESDIAVALNNAMEPVITQVHGTQGRSWEIELAPGTQRWMTTR